MLYYSYYDSALQTAPASPFSVSLSLCLISVSRNPSLCSLGTLSKSPPLLSFPLSASEGLVLQDAECTEYNQSHKKVFVHQLLLTPTTYHMPSTSRHVRQRCYSRCLSTNLSVSGTLFIPEITHMLYSKRIEMLLILQNHSLEEYT